MKSGESLTTGDVVWTSLGGKFVFQRCDARADHIYVTLTKYGDDSNELITYKWEDFHKLFFRRHTAWEVLDTLDLKEEPADEGRIVGHLVFRGFTNYQKLEMRFSRRSKQFVRETSEASRQAQEDAAKEAHDAAQNSFHGGHSSTYEPYEPLAWKIVLNGILDEEVEVQPQTAMGGTSSYRLRKKSQMSFRAFSESL